MDFTCNAHTGLKRVVDLLKLKSQPVVNCPAGAGAEPRVSGRAASAVNH